MTTHFGVDWARNGWIVAASEGNNPPSIKFYPTIEDIGDDLQPGDRLAIDIPIGLPSDSRRACDLDAKRVLKGRGNSVFYTPTRDAVAEENIELAKDAQQDLDFSVQNQAWAIVPRIREVDTFLQRHQNEFDEDQFVETHPEIAFAALNSGNPLSTAKKDDSGLAERLDLLEPSLIEVRSVFKAAKDVFETPDYAMKLARGNDILDALVALVVAKTPPHNRGRLPINDGPEPDDHLQRPCEIVLPCEVEWIHE